MIHSCCVDVTRFIKELVYVVAVCGDYHRSDRAGAMGRAMWEMARANV